MVITGCCCHLPRHERIEFGRAGSPERPHRGRRTRGEGSPTGTCSASTGGAGRERDVPREFAASLATTGRESHYGPRRSSYPGTISNSTPNSPTPGTCTSPRAAPSTTTPLVVDDTAWREAFYVGMSRGRHRNTAYVITERARAADLAPEPRLASCLEDPGAARDAPPRPHRLAVLAGVLERRQAGGRLPSRCDASWTGPRAWPPSRRSGRT
jgi:hypothetical protein